MEGKINIIEAIKSGKRFRRSGGDWAKVSGEISGRIIIKDMSGGQKYVFSKEDILANDWEVEEKKVEITYEQLESALKKFLFFSAETTINLIAKELGLIE